MRGRKPLPTGLKLLRGTLEKQRINPTEPKPAVGEGTALKGLTPRALEHYAKLTEQVTAMGILTVVDGSALSGLAQAMADFEEASVILARDGKVIEGRDAGMVRSPWLMVRKQAEDRMKQGFADFGLTPAARARLHTEPKPKKDAAEELFG